MKLKVVTNSILFLVVLPTRCELVGGTASTTESPQGPEITTTNNGNPVESESSDTTVTVDFDGYEFLAATGVPIEFTGTPEIIITTEAPTHAPSPAPSQASTTSAPTTAPTAGGPFSSMTVPYMTPDEVFDWLNRQTSNPEDALSCMIRASEGAVGKFDSIMTASTYGTDVYLDNPRTNALDQRWIITNRHDTSEQNGFGAYNIYAQTVESQRSLLSTTRDGNVDLWKEDDESGRQKWMFQYMGVDTGNGVHDIDRWSNRGGVHRFAIKVVNGTFPGETYLSTDGNSLVDLWVRDDSSGRQYWDLINCYETAPPGKSFVIVDERDWALQADDADCTGKMISKPKHAAKSQQFFHGPNKSIISRFCNKVLKPDNSPCNQQYLVFADISERFDHPWDLSNGDAEDADPWLFYEGDNPGCRNVWVWTPQGESELVWMRNSNYAIFHLEYG